MVRALIKNRSRRFWYAIAGFIAGLLVGHLVGGVGVAMRGGAFRIDAEIVLAIAGAILGYWAARKADRQSKEAGN